MLSLLSPEMRGRVMALYGIVFLGTTPIGAPIAGWVGQHANPRIALAGGGLIALVTGLAGLWLLARRGAGDRGVPAQAVRGPQPDVA